MARMTMASVDVLEFGIGLFWFLAAASWSFAAADRVDVLQRQTRWNRIAAVCAGVARQRS